MRRTLLFYIIICLCVAAIVVLGFRAWIEMQQPTVVIEWATSSEIDTAGFNLYRVTGSDDPWIKVNDYLIPASPDPLTGGSYHYEDKEVEPHADYQYYLEEVEVSGNINRYGPVEVAAKRGGQIELFLVIALTGILLFLIFLLRKISREGSRIDV